MSGLLDSVYGPLVVARPPVPVTVNKAGANYKSEIPHLTYSPRAAYLEWLAVCDAVVAAGGDAIVAFEDVDEPFLGKGDLRVDGDGLVYTQHGAEPLGDVADIETGRVFAANGPWVAASGDQLEAVMPHMLPHRRSEASYFETLLESLATSGGYRLRIHKNPHRWEGMADVTVVDGVAIFTYAVAGHYDQGVGKKSERSSREGGEFAADTLAVPADARLFVELVYPHFHGDTVHFTARASETRQRLLHYPDGLWGDGAARLSERVGESLYILERADAVDHYAANSRQIGSTLLSTRSVSSRFQDTVRELGLEVCRLGLDELFGKAGGGPGCTTLYLPANLRVAADFPHRYSRLRTEAAKRAERVPRAVTVAPEFFEARTRG